MSTGIPAYLSRLQSVLSVLVRVLYLYCTRIFVLQYLYELYEYRYDYLYVLYSTTLAKYG